ncbi:hypothetical protein CS542_06915 [Pedobacter sp. IW39]|nr:hypothetical protein CS542_06915 [Pedobacter sp. IW39]
MAVLYIKENGIKPLHMLDVGGPGMMLAASAIGCHMSGDGIGYCQYELALVTWLRLILIQIMARWKVLFRARVSSNVMRLPVYPTPIYYEVIVFYLFYSEYPSSIKLPE